MKILFLFTDTTESIKLGQLVVTRLRDNDTIIVEQYPSTKVTNSMIFEFLTRYDIIIFDGSIENNAALNNAKYDFLDLSTLSLDNFFVVTRNTLPMNFVPPHSNLNQYDALINNMYQIDKNRVENSSIEDIISNETIVNWVQQEIKMYVAMHEDYHRPETMSEVLYNLRNGVGLVMNPNKPSKKKQIFISFRGHYQTEKYYGFNIDDVKDWIKNTYHAKDIEEWDDPFIYDSGVLTSELMPEQRQWTVQSIISAKIQECDEFWIFDTKQERDVNGSLIHYSYWDSWWCVAEVMEILQLHTRGKLGKNFKLHIFDPTLPDKHEVIHLENLPMLSPFEERELMRLKSEGDIMRSNLHLRKEKRRFRDAFGFIKKIKYKILHMQWDIFKKIFGIDISIPFDLYLEDVSCRVYDDSFLTQRIYMDPPSMEIGRTREDVLKKDYCKHFMNLVGTYKDTPQYEGIYMTTTKELENELKHNLPIVVRRTQGDLTTQKVFQVEEYGKMFFFWIPKKNSLIPKCFKRTGPNHCTIQEIPLCRIK